MEAIQVEFPLPYHEIASMSEFGGNMWVGTEHGEIHVLTQNTESLSHPFILSSKTPFSEEHSIIQTMFAIEQIGKLFAFVKQENVGKIIMIDSSYKVETFSEGVTYAARSPHDALPAFVLAKNNLFYYYLVKDNTLQPPVEVDALSTINGISVNNSGVAFYANSQYFLWWRVSKRVMNVAACVLPNSCIVPDKNSFVFCMKDMLQLMEKMAKRWQHQ
ncbi:hypothetical protein TVAG_040890 [Trichomonas vaginalis G3]|uniref:Vps16 N-terminal domain-containing protein n=1 Tax=Trichomonas vaginalis (strain ATCC PRA-98 / G3) TaxID=412133 RepID=A2EWQ1_TRIV3|nr:hypothetical protein TVAGG3_0569190 [Trichomonas vaginalis G3]EAY02939.1 hypothetical protein TVAG_040890 [Trichomonas vaginalis G3]KAI5521789.1 hypothetical protein TVAGG3_0569190 [Trichomonas vaginalis G3]|eukprot:XP_001315162.1 hypothetical protein [Trichomonas vaginalis G3]